MTYAVSGKGNLLLKPTNQLSFIGKVKSVGTSLPLPLIVLRKSLYRLLTCLKNPVLPLYILTPQTSHRSIFT